MTIRPHPSHWRSMAIRVFAALGVSIALSGCVIEPLYGPHYYRPHPYYGYGY